MISFAYVAHDGSGKKLRGTISASTRRDALTSLTSRKLVPVRLKKESESRFRFRGIKTSAVETTYEMLSDLLESGMPLSQALDVLCQSTSDRSLLLTAESVRDAVVDGASLATAMAQHPSVFNNFSISLIEAGERGGFLEQALQELAELTRREQELRARVLSALAYPCFLLAVGVLVIIGMLAYFVPNFQPLFAQMESDGRLPWATTALLSTSDFLRNNLALIVAVLGVLVLVVLSRTDRGWRRATSLNAIVRLPVIGPIIANLAIARLARLLGTMLHGGVPVVQALEIAGRSVEFPSLREAVKESSESVQAGGTISEPLGRCRLFAKEMVEMLSVGEKSNRLEKILLLIAEKLENRTQRKIDTAVKLIEPSMMVVMACSIGFLIVALLMPVFNSTDGFYSP